MTRELIPTWIDTKTGATAAVTDKPFDPVKLGVNVTLAVPAKPGEFYAMAFKIEDGGGTVVVDKSDTNYPWRASALDTGPIAFKPGTYAFTIIALAGPKLPAADVKPVRGKFTILDTTTPKPNPPVVVTVPTPPAKPDDDAPSFLFGAVDLGMKISLPVRSKLWTGTKTMAEVMAPHGVAGGRNWRTTTGGPSDPVPNWGRMNDWAGVGIRRFVLACAAGGGNWAGKPEPTPATTRESFKRLCDSVPSKIHGILDMEISNEFGPKMAGYYWPYSLAKFVDSFLNPAVEVCRAAGLRTILGGLNYGGQAAIDLAEVLHLGGDVECVGWHPYPTDVASYKSTTAALVSVAGKRRLIETESQTKDGPGVLKWYNNPKDGTATTPATAAAKRAAMLAATATFPTIEAVYEFSTEWQTRTMTGPLGWFAFETADKVATLATTSDTFNARFAGKF